MPSPEHHIENIYTGIIPARYASTRFPGKPLALVNGVPMIVKVWEKAREALGEVYISTDHKSIYNIARSVGADVILTPTEIDSRTARVAETAARLFGQEESTNRIILNIQGDEPLITTQAIKSLCGAFKGNQGGIATLVHRIQDHSTLQNPNRPKVVTDLDMNALYFSRSAIPWYPESKIPGEGAPVYQHIGIYGFRYPILQKLMMLAPTPLEKAEGLEQLRWMQHGYTIKCVETEYDGFGIDTPDDLANVNRRLEGL